MVYALVLERACRAAFSIHIRMGSTDGLQKRLRPRQLLLGMLELIEAHGHIIYRQNELGISQFAKAFVALLVRQFLTKQCRHLHLL